jgi:hypothetical protein
MDLIQTVDGLRNQDDGDRSVLDAFVASFAVFALPEITVVDDLAGLRER